MSLPLNGTWTTGAPMPTGKQHGACAAIGDKIYYAGGRTAFQLNNQSVSNTLEIYDTKNNTWSSGQNAPVAVTEAGVAISDHNIYVVGGSSYTESKNTIQIYNTLSGNWEISPYTLPTARFGLKCYIVKKKLYCIGGITVRKDSSYTDKVEILDLDSGAWITGAPLPKKCSWGSCSLYNNCLYWISGFGKDKGADTAHVYKYDIATDTWEVYCDAPFPYHVYGCAQDNNHVYCAGGNKSVGIDDGVLVANVYEFNIDSRSFTYMPELSIACKAIECALVEGRLYAIGGAASNPTARILNTVNIYPADAPTPPPSDKCCCTEVELKIKTCSCNTDLLDDLNTVLKKDGQKGCGTSGCDK